jgi:cation diffusion facilitator family transporter
MPAPHSHNFLGQHHDRNARRTWLVIGLTTAMMVAEIIAGSWFGSMALLADGWHMSTHAGALLIAAAAYTYAARHCDDPRFTYGTGKMGDLAAFASAIILALIAVLIAWESAQRLISPVSIDFNEAIAVAVIGLVVNMVSALLLAHKHPGNHHGHDHDHYSHAHCDHRHHGHGHDTNLRAAYLHVLADALTSVLAILALVSGKLLGWAWLDPAMGLLGALVILHWSRGLIRTAASTLLDMVPDADLRETAQERLEESGARVVDLHLWRLGPGHIGVSAAVATENPRPVHHYRDMLASLPGVSHVTVEVESVTVH